MKVKFTVTLELPSDVSIGEMCTYIQESVQSNIGMLSPEKSLYHLDRSSVTVSCKLPADVAG